MSPETVSTRSNAHVRRTSGRRAAGAFERLETVSVSLSLLVLLLALTGCGVGGILRGTAGGGGGGGGGSNPPPPPPVVVAVPQGQSASNYVTFQFILRDPQVREDEGRPGGARDPRVRVEPQFQLPGSETWFDMTEAALAGSDGTRALPLGQHTFVWNTLIDLGDYSGEVRVRVLAEYEESSGIRRRFRTREVRFRIDNRLAATLFGRDVHPPLDVDTFPVDMRPDGSAFVVAALGANIVERVEPNGVVRRLAGFGVPGDTVGTGRDPGVARLRTIGGVELDAAGNLYTNHDDSILVTNRSAATLAFGTVSVSPRTIEKGLVGLTSSRGVRFHPSGALLFLNAGTELLAFNPQDPADPGATDIVLAGVTVEPGAFARIAGGGTDADDGAVGTDAELTDAISVAVGPDGEVYFAERALGRVRVLVTGAAPLVIGGRTVAAGTVDTVLGGNGLGDVGDGGPARLAQLNLPGGIDVSAARVLFVADTSNVRVRMANLGVAPVTFAETTVQAGGVDTVVGGGDGGIGSKARDLALGTPNAASLDSAGNLLVADQRSVILVNGGTTTITSYGRTAGPARTAQVYDATLRGGVPLIGPRAVHPASPEAVFFSDRSTVRVLNLGTSPMVVGGAAPDPGAVGIVAGGSVPGFSGDGGPARTAAFAAPAALVTEGPTRLFVADTDNDRVRFLHVGDPRADLPQTVLGVSIAAGNVDTIVGGAPGPLTDDGDGLTPRAASLLRPQGVAATSAGLLFVADTGHHRIRVVNPGPADVVVAGVPVSAGTIETVIGGGAAGFTPDGAGPWLVDTPTALTTDRDLLYFAEVGNARIRALNLSSATVRAAGIDIPPGEIRTLVGSGVRGNSGDGGQGPDVSIDTPRGLFVQTVDTERTALYFSDHAQNVVRMLNLTDEDLVAAVDASGRAVTTAPAGGVVTLAGGPNVAGFPNPPAFAGDGDEAVRMRFSGPWGVAVVLRNGVPAHFLVADEGNDRLRRFGP